MPVTVEDAMKVVLPLIAGAVSSYSAPASRAIQGAAGAYTALDEQKQREADAAQERQIRADEGTRRNKILDMQAADIADKKAQRNQNTQNLGALFGSVLAQHSGTNTAPIEGTGGVQGGLGVSEDQARQDADIATAARIGQAGVNNPAIAQAALAHIMSSPKQIAEAAQRWEQFQSTLGQRQAEAAAEQKYRNATLDLQNRGLASEDAYRKGIVDVRNQEADTKAKGRAGADLIKVSNNIATLRKRKDEAASGTLGAVWASADEALLNRLQTEYSAALGTGSNAAAYNDTNLPAVLAKIRSVR